MDVSNESLTDERAFSEAVIRYERLLFSVGYSVLRNREQCADAVQNAIFKAWKQIKLLRDPAKFKSWLVRILLNECRSMKRRQEPLPLTEDIPFVQPDRETKLDVNKAVMSLEEKFRIPIVLYYFEDMPVAEIAAALGVPKGTVLSRLARARDQLRKELE